MPVTALIRSTKVNDQYKNNGDFEFNKDTQYAPNLIGSVMERVKVRQIIQFSYNAYSSDLNKFIFDNTTTPYTLTRQTGTWQDDGISIGDEVRILVTGTPLFVTTVSNTNENTIIFEDTGDFPVGMNPGEYGTAVSFRLYGQSPLENIYYKFGIIENNESANYINKVTKNQQGYSGVGIGLDDGGGRDTDFVQLEPLGDYKDWVTGEAFCRFTQEIDTGTRLLQEFEIHHNFIIVPYYRDGKLQDLINNVMPDELKGFATLKYINEADLRKSLNNPSSSKVSVMDYVKGSTGWFDENFDGIKSNYELASISYEDDATVTAIESLKLSGRTNVTVVVKKLSGDFLADNKAGVYVSYLPPSDEYTNVTTEYVSNFIYDNGFTREGDPATQGQDYIKDITSSISGDELTINFSTEFSTAQALRLLDALEPYYLIAVQVGDVSLTTVNSDKVMLKTDVAEFNNTINLIGLANIEEFAVWHHPDDYDATAGNTDFTGWVEDGLLHRLRFNLDLAKEAFINSIQAKLIAYDSTTKQYFELDTYNISTQSATVSGGVQQLEADETRGYELAENDQFNLVQLTTGAKVGDLQSYELLIGQKLTWQDWQSVEADTVFYDKTKPENNLNRKSSNYSGLNNYDIHIAYQLNLSGVDDKGQSGVTDYLILSPELIAQNYDTPLDWSAEIKTYDPTTLNDLELQVYTNKQTLFEITWTKAAGGVTDISDFWAIHRIEITGQQGAEIYELSTLRDYPDNNPLIPVAGEARLKKELVAGKVVTTCLIIPTLAGSNFNLSGRIGDGASSIPEGAKFTEDGILKLTEDGIIKIIE